MKRTVTLVSEAPPIPCPSCAARIGWNCATFHTPFLCPGCSNGLQLSSSYARVVNATSILATGLVAYALGVRGNALFWLICLGWFPASVVVMTVSLRLFPPDAHLTGEFSRRSLRRLQTRDRF